MSEENENTEAEELNPPKAISTEVSMSVIKPSHVNLKEEFLARVKFLISQESEIKGYGISENYGIETERIELKINGFDVDIRVTKGR